VPRCGTNIPLTITRCTWERPLLEFCGTSEKCQYILYFKNRGTLMRWYLTIFLLVATAVSGTRKPMRLRARNNIKSQREADGCWWPTSSNPTWSGRTFTVAREYEWRPDYAVCARVKLLHTAHSGGKKEKQRAVRKGKQSTTPPGLDRPKYSSVSKKNIKINICSPTRPKKNITAQYLMPMENAFSVDVFLLGFPPFCVLLLT